MSGLRESTAYYAVNAEQVLHIPYQILGVSSSPACSIMARSQSAHPHSLLKSFLIPEAPICGSLVLNVHGQTSPASFTANMTPQSPAPTRSALKLCKLLHLKIGCIARDRCNCNCHSDASGFFWVIRGSHCLASRTPCVSMT